MSSVSYTLSAKAGQVMTVVLKPSNTATYFNVYAPGRGPGDEALAVSEMTGPMVPDMNQFKGALPETGVYTVSVYLYRSAARRNEKSNYTLDIAIAAQGGASEVPPVQGDFADGLAGGPDFWEVTGVPAGDTLNMRKGPSTKDSVVMAFANGSVLRNKGCRMEGGQRWCQVERPMMPRSGAGWQGVICERRLRLPTTDRARMLWFRERTSMPQETCLAPALLASRWAVANSALSGKGMAMPPSRCFGRMAAAE